MPSLQEYATFKPPTATYPDLKDKRVLITGEHSKSATYRSQPTSLHGSWLNFRLVSAAGGSAGIGKATAEAFSQNGAKVVVAGRRLPRLQAVVDSLPNKAFAVAADLMIKADVERLVAESVGAVVASVSFVRCSAHLSCLLAVKVDGIE